MDFKVEVISVSIEMICGGSVPGGRAVEEAGTDVDSGFARGAMGVFSLLS